MDVFEDGESPPKAGMSLLARYGVRMSDGKAPSLLHPSDVVGVAVQGETMELQRKLETTAGLVRAFDSNLPIVPLEFLIGDLMLRVSRLPKTHGKTAGANGRGTTAPAPVPKRPRPARPLSTMPKSARRLTREPIS